MHIEGETKECKDCKNSKGCKEKNKEQPTCFNWEKR